MRRFAWLMCAALLAGACAHIEAPTGGEEDRQAPQLLTTRPDTFARAQGLRTPAVFVFDEGLSEEGIEEAVTVSPRTSPVVVDKNGEELRVSLRRGWEPNRIYQVVVDSTVRDRFNNRIGEAVRLVFSTGPAIPETFLSGTVLERQTARPAAGARVEAIHRPDSLVYSTRTGADGTFAFAQIPEGEYTVRAFTDVNNTRALETFEARDTTAARVATGAQPSVALSIVAPDSTPPRPNQATAIDSTGITVRFDDFLDPAQRIAVTQVTLFSPDSTPLRVASVVIGTETPAAAPDSGAVRDSAAAPRTVRPGADTARAAPGAPAAAQGPVPSQTVTIRAAAPLRPDAQYTIRVDGVRNLVGLVGGGSVRFRTPRAPAPPPAAPATPPAGTTAAPGAPPARPPATPPGATSRPTPAPRAPAPTQPPARP